MNDWTFVTADDEELNTVLSGHGTVRGYPWPRRSIRRGSLAHQVGVLILESPIQRARPAALVVSEDASRRLFGRYAQLRSDLSPLSAWAHILEPEHLDLLQNDARPAAAPVVRTPDLQGLEAAWIGLTVAEALIRSERPLSQLKLAACLATPTFALARAQALWPKETIAAVLQRYDLCQKLIRSADAPQNKLREPLMDIWTVLTAVSSPMPHSVSPDLRDVVQATARLHMARASGQSETDAIQTALDMPQTEFLRRLESAPPEARVREFDRLVAALDASRSSRERANLLFAAGYLVTVLAGGSPSLGMAERLLHRWPQVTAWAYVLGSLGETVTWTSGFDGLGRLVARELSRPFRLDEPPTSDFALAEANIVVDRGLSDPLVHLRIKQARVLSVALLPGVTIAVPIVEATSSETRPAPRSADTGDRKPSTPASSDPMAILADALAPHLIERLKEWVSAPTPKEPSTTGSSRSSRSRGAKRDAELPLGMDRDRTR